MSADTAAGTVEFTPRYSLGHLTLLDCSVPELVYIAARAGYDYVSPRLAQMGVPGESPIDPLDKDMVQATKIALRATGLEVHDIELARITDNCDVSAYEPAFALGAEMGAKQMISSAWTSRTDDRDYVVEKFGEICDLGAKYGISVSLEYPSFSRLPTLNAVIDILKAANRPNAGVLVDTMYTHLSHTTVEEFEGLPVNWFKFIHIADLMPGIPENHEGMLQVVRDHRLYPGWGCIDFKAIVERLPPVVYSIELPNRPRAREHGYEGHARRCLKTAKEVLDDLRSKVNA